MLTVFKRRLRQARVLPGLCLCPEPGRYVLHQPLFGGCLNSAGDLAEAVTDSPLGQHVARLGRIRFDLLAQVTDVQLE